MATARRTIHLVQRGLEGPLRCLACGEIAATGPNPVPERGRPAVCRNRRDWETIYTDHPNYRRCIDDLDIRDRPAAPFPVPAEEGFYWAEWRIVEDGTFPDAPGDEQKPVGAINHPSTFWVVLVRNQGSYDNPEFVADVPGYDRAQPVENFVWRSERLEAPK